MWTLRVEGFFVVLFLGWSFLDAFGKLEKSRGYIRERLREGLVFQINFVFS